MSCAAAMVVSTRNAALLCPAEVLFVAAQPHVIAKFIAPFLIRESSLGAHRRSSQLPIAAGPDKRFAFCKAKLLRAAKRTLFKRSDLILQAYSGLTFHGPHGLRPLLDRPGRACEWACERACSLLSAHPSANTAGSPPLPGPKHTSIPVLPGGARHMQSAFEACPCCSSNAGCVTPAHGASPPPGASPTQICPQREPSASSSVQLSTVCGGFAAPSTAAESIWSPFFLPVLLSRTRISPRVKRA